MVKSSGGVRNVPVGSSAYNNRLAEVAAMRASGRYSSVEMSENGTGWIAIEKGKAKHKPEEIEAARHLANKGYKITLGDETGSVTVPDGKLFSATFEQKTPEAGGSKGINKALEHAKKKDADIAVIYDKHRTYNRNEVYHLTVFKFLFGIYYDIGYNIPSLGIMRYCYSYFVPTVYKFFSRHDNC